MLVPIGAAALALTAALAAYVMVKFYGVIFLGRPREAALAQAHDCGRLERVGLLWLAAGCVLLGLLPVPMLALLDRVNAELLGAVMGGQADSWWYLAPVSAERATYNPAAFLLGIAVAFGLTFWGVRRLYHGRTRKVDPWDCGFPLQTPRMQDSAEGFGQPIRQIFEPFFLMRRELPSPFDVAPRYKVDIEDKFWRWCYVPVAWAVDGSARLIGLLQQGRISTYLLFSFLTLIALLVLVL